ncbi:MAG: hypothetical protein K2H22_02505, partial [Muribaculaceae bacterium]|nr:hypothetical protein [Muribaculaceae bacterium]
NFGRGNGGVYGNGAGWVNMPAVYDTRTQKLQVYNEVQNIDMYDIGLTPTAIANDGTFIGILGSAVLNGGAFIMKAGETQAEMFTEAFNEYSEVFEFLDLCGYHMPADISADGRRIIGNGWYSTDQDPYASDANFYFMTYVIDRGETSGIPTAGADMDTATPTDYYTIDGRHLDTTVKGINIIRMSDGSVRKVIH